MHTIGIQGIVKWMHCRGPGRKKGHPKPTVVQESKHLQQSQQAQQIAGMRK